MPITYLPKCFKRTQSIIIREIKISEAVSDGLTVFGHIMNNTEPECSYTNDAKIYHLNFLMQTAIEKVKLDF